ncbi:hypothetical protein K1T71_012153 [Dendrolimus kikuchii]|uniref:Uncharacterized protein n=1 Tax=Dendrolimus kikuchii TaxID=765133 RepID=A0ACC1CKZ5_9NEOP|nr:hypothetical protein K1T71_012153 [Dendrolimus kikuchii]
MNFLKQRTRSRRNSTNVLSNTEKWRNYSKRISRRGNDLFEENSDEDEPKYNEIKDWVQEFFNRKSELISKGDQDVEVKLSRKQTLMLATLVPDELLLMNTFNSGELKRFVGVILMADVSGYTALTEKYHNTGKGGTYRLTVTLNTYLGSLIELIYSHGGDILKFAGDAFLALWKTDKRTFLCHTIHTAIACALLIQHSYSSYETDVKVNLRVKLAISAGNLIFAPIGTGIDMNYVIFGLPVLEAKAAESVCASGEVKLTPTAWGHCYSRNYDYVINSDGYITIKSILYDPHESDVTKPFLGFGAMVRQMKRAYTAIENLPDHLLDPSKGLSASNILQKSDALNLRKTIVLAEEKNIGSEIRKFMIRPVLTQVDAHQPLEYLTEMRQVSVLFMTLKPTECPFPQIITIVNNAYQITCEIVYKSMGCVNKIILFDKDIMVLVVFGLRGFKHESEAHAALKCAYSIKKSVSALDGVLEVSLGVTTGQVYCGVVGHPLRREFTVIGAVVNKAARLMCNFRNKITCDESSFIKSKMSSNGFTLQPETKLKGIRKPGKIFEYSEDIRVKELYDIPMVPPLLNRSDEMEYYQSWLEDSALTYRDFDALLIVGEPRIGKSRLLEWMARYARNREFRVCSVNLTSVHSATPYLALSQMLNQILGIKEPISGFIKEEKIVQLLKMYSEDLCYLNNIIKVRFAYHEGVYSHDENKRKEKAKQMFSKIISSIEDTLIVFLDDLQNLDAFSWEYISLMFNSMKIFTVISVARGNFTIVQSWLYSVFINNNIRKIVLGPLESFWITPLACQILDVNAIPYDLYDALKSKCNGIPGLMENFIIHLFSSGALELKKIQESELHNWNDHLQFSGASYLHPQALNAKDQSTLDKFLENDSTGEIKICEIIHKEELNTNLNVQNLDALIMIQIDSLTPYQQLLLKIASVIGNVLSRDLLENIMYENDRLTTAKAVKRLFSLRILSCANVTISKWSSRITSNARLSMATTQTNLLCDCSFEYDPETSENLPKYAFCKVMKFRNKNARKTCYELLPLNQKKEFHSRIVNYLENTPQKCLDCGGTVTIVQSLLSLVPDIDNENGTIHYKEQFLKSSDNDDSSSETEEENNLKRNLSSRPSSHANNLQICNTETTDRNSNVDVKSETNAVQGTDKIIHAPILKSEQNLHDSVSKQRSSKRVTMTKMHLIKQKSKAEESTGLKIFDIIREVTEAENSQDWRKLGIVDSLDDLKPEKENKNRKSLSIKIAKGVSLTNVDKCTCSELKIIISEQLIHHALQADLRKKTIEFIIQCCYLNILASTTENILLKFEEAEQLCTENHETINKFDRKRFLGKIYSLRAASYLLENKLLAAKLEIERALRIYHINLHNVSNVLKFKTVMNIIKMGRRKYREHEVSMKSDSIYCLNVATLLYSSLGEEKLSRMAAIRALYLIQTIQCNVIDICDTYSNAIQVELDRGATECTSEIEKMATLSLKQLPSPVQANELFSVGKLFMASFRARMARGQLAAAVRSGFRSLTVSRFLQAHGVSLEIIPDLFYVLLCRRRIEEAIDVVQLAMNISRQRLFHNSETWYYALCIDLILDGGFQLVSPQEISNFAEFALSRGKSGGSGRRRLVLGLWTYWLRADNERKAKRFESEALSWVSHDDESNFTDLMSAMRLAEGMLESLARKVDDLRKVVDLMELRSIADRELSRLEKDVRFWRALYPRWTLLKANSLKLSGRLVAANTLYNQALDDALRTHNRLEESLTRAALSNSVFWIQNARNGSFIDWRPGLEHARTSWHQLMYKISTTRYQAN